MIAMINFFKGATPLILEINAQVCTTHIQGCAMHATPISYHVVTHDQTMIMFGL